MTYLICFTLLLLFPLLLLVFLLVVALTFAPSSLSLPVGFPTGIPSGFSGGFPGIRTIRVRVRVDMEQGKTGGGGGYRDHCRGSHCEDNCKQKKTLKNNNNNIVTGLALNASIHPLFWVNKQHILKQDTFVKSCYYLFIIIWLCRSDLALYCSQNGKG